MPPMRLWRVRAALCFLLHLSLALFTLCGTLTSSPAHAQIPTAVNPPRIYYIHADHLNTPRVVTERATNGMRWTWWSEPFGTAYADENPGKLGAFTLPLRFPGQYYDAESGMHYNVNRDYMAGSGRYAQSDPIGLNGGTRQATDDTMAAIRGPRCFTALQL